MYLPSASKYPLPLSPVSTAPGTESVSVPLSSDQLMLIPAAAHTASGGRNTVSPETYARAESSPSIYTGHGLHVPAVCCRGKAGAEQAECQQQGERRLTHSYTA